jgi:cation/acetate symporter
VNVTASVFFAAIVAVTLGITYWASKRNTSTSDHYVASKGITGWQNGLAITGDFVSVGGFLGITGAIALQGFNGFYLSYGIPIAFLLVLLVVAEPMRNLGKYTVGDVITSRFGTRSVRAIAAVNTLLISIVYMISQFVGAGALIQLLLGINYNVAVVVIGVLASVYILAGGMLATTWIQIFKAVLLLSGTFLLLLLVLSRFDFNPVAVFDETAATLGDGVVLPSDYGGLLANLDVLSITIAVALGPVGLPHVLMRFLTVLDARTARSSVAVASVFMGLFFILLPILGYGAAIYVGQAEISAANPAGNLAAPQLSEALGGDLLLAFIAAVSFATLLAVMAGIVIAASGAFAHDLHQRVVRRPGNGPRAAQGGPHRRGSHLRDRPHPGFRRPGLQPGIPRHSRLRHGGERKPPGHTADDLLEKVQPDGGGERYGGRTRKLGGPRACKPEPSGRERDLSLHQPGAGLYPHRLPRQLLRHDLE